MAELIQIKSYRFPVPLIVEALDGDEDWRVSEHFTCIDEVFGEIAVEKGTITDFGSIKKPVTALISPTSRYRKPFIIHDEQYTKQESKGKALSQKDADRCLLRGMIERDKVHNEIAPWYKRKFGLERNTIYIALRIAGRFAWEEHRKEKLARQYQEKANGQSVGTNKNP